MPKQLVDFYKINVSFNIQKDYWDIDNPKISPKIIASKIQSGVEVPIEDCKVTITK